MAEKKRTETKGKYAALIKKAREQENQGTREPDDQMVEEPENQAAREPQDQLADEPKNQVARKPGSQKTSKSDNQLTRELDNQEISTPKNQATIKPEGQLTSKEENQITRQPEAPQEKEVNLCVKVPQSLRRHWAAESKRQGITMTEVIVQALSDRFGTPDSRGR